MTARNPFNLLSGKKGLVLGVANRNSIGYGAALAFHRAGAEIMLTYGRPTTEQYVRPLLGDLGAPDLLHCDVRDDAQLEALFAHIEAKWGRLDFLLHAIAYAPKKDLHGRVVDCLESRFRTPPKPLNTRPTPPTNGYFGRQCLHLDPYRCEGWRVELIKLGGG